MNPQVSVLIVNYKTPELVIECISSFEEHVTATSYEIIVVDNGSGDNSVEVMKDCCPEARIIANPLNVGFGEGNNIAFRHARGEFVFLTNSDTRLREDTVTPLVNFLKNHCEASMVGPSVFLPDGSPQPRVCGNVPTLRRLINDALLLSALLPKLPFFSGLHLDHISREVTRVGWISGVCMLIRRHAFEGVNGFDPAYFLYAEDIDLCLRVSREFGPIYHLNNYGIVHYHGASSTTEHDRMRNCVLQQKNLLRVLSATQPPSHVKRARLILKSGLLLRVGISHILEKLGRSQDSFLLRSSLARLAALKEQRS